MSGKGFKGSLSSLYHENRASFKGMKTQSLINKAKRELENEREDAKASGHGCARPSAFG